MSGFSSAAAFTTWERALQQRHLSLHSLLGSGAFGDTYLAHDQHGIMLALKRSRLPILKESVLEEVFGMLRLCCWHTTQQLDAWLDHDMHVTIVMEYCDRGTLRSRLRGRYPLREEEVVSIFTQTLLGLHHLHRKKIVHRDIKLDNILLSSELGDELLSVKLTDFGISRHLEDSNPRAISDVGTAVCLPPEVAAGYGYTAKSDVWSLGVVMYTLLANRDPFATRIERGERCVHYSAPPHPCVFSAGEYARPLGDVVMTMLNEKWKRRPSTEALLRCSVFRDMLLRSPWVSNDRMGLVWATVRESVLPVMVYADCSPMSLLVRMLTTGDQVLLSRLPSTIGVNAERWIRVEVPCSGFIRGAERLNRQLETFNEGGLSSVMGEVNDSVLSHG